MPRGIEGLWEKQGDKFVCNFTNFGEVVVFRTPVYRYDSGRRIHGWVAVGPGKQLMISSPTGYKDAESAMSSAEFVFKFPKNASEPLQDDSPLYDVIEGVYGR